VDNANLLCRSIAEVFTEGDISNHSPFLSPGTTVCQGCLQVMKCGKYHYLNLYYHQPNIIDI